MSLRFNTHTANLVIFCISCTASPLPSCLKKNHKDSRRRVKKPEELQEKIAAIPFCSGSTDEQGWTSDYRSNRYERHKVENSTRLLCCTSRLSFTTKTKKQVAAISSCANLRGQSSVSICTMGGSRQRWHQYRVRQSQCTRTLESSRHRSSRYWKHHSQTLEGVLFAAQREIKSIQKSLFALFTLSYLHIFWNDITNQLLAEQQPREQAEFQTNCTTLDSG